MTTVVNRRKELFDVYIGRGSKWGNPFIIGKDGTREDVIAKYRKRFYENLKTGSFTHEEVIKKLAGTKLGCYCAPMPCHGDVLAEYCNMFSLIENDEAPF